MRNRSGKPPRPLREKTIQSPSGEYEDERTSVDFGK
jgi:hypothetical protein